MPEGPEVATIANDLHKFFCDEKSIVKKMNIISGKYTKPENSEDLETLSCNFPLRIMSVICFGKFIKFEFKNKYNDRFFIGSTLGMTGKWKVSETPLPFLKHDRIQFEISKNGRKVHLVYNDIRQFGNITVYFNYENINIKISKLGLPWLIKDDVSYKIGISYDSFYAVIKNCPRMNVCRFLMDQTKTAGVGNYLLSEIVFDCELNYKHCINELSNFDIKNLYDSCCKLIKDSFEDRGVSIKDYESILGQKGKFQEKLKVYGKENSVIDTNVIKRIKGPHGRSLFII